MANCLWRKIRPHKCGCGSVLIFITIEKKTNVSSVSLAFYICAVACMRTEMDLLRVSRTVAAVEKEMSYYFRML